MGSDIHLYVEMRQEDGTWRVVPSHHDEAQRAILTWSIGRCYLCFALLAGVRNSWGVTPIAEPRGVPDDLSPEVKDLARRVADDAYSQSWLALPEILSFDFDTLVTFDGVVTLEEFKEYLESGTPGTDCGVGREISNDDMKRLALEGQSPDDTTVYCTNLTWRESYRSSCGCVLALCGDLKALGDPERIRIVFWFDT